MQLTPLWHSMQARLDASTAGTSHQQTLAAAVAPAPASDAGTAAAAQGPAAELLLRTGAAPGAEPSSEQVATPDGGTAQLQGAATAVLQQHADEKGGSHVNITLTGLPANYSDATAACAFPALADVQRLETLSLQASLLTHLAALRAEQWRMVVTVVMHTHEVVK
jgi:hypothetical protein